MTAMVVTPAYAEPTALSRALKGLAKVHALPAYQALYGAHRAAVVLVAPEDAEAWRAALGASPYFADDRQPSEYAAEVFWLGAKIEIRYTTNGEH